MILITDGPFPPDVRVEKEVIPLTKKGHRVTVLARRTSGQESEFEALGPDYWVRRIALPKGSFLAEIVSRFTLIHPEYLEPIREFIRQEKPQVLHVHDFNLVPTVLRVSKPFHIPVVADLHENMPAALVAYRSHLPTWRRWISAIFKNYYLWRWHEKRALSQCAKIIVVVPEAAERLLAYGIPPEKIIVVSNTEDEARYQPNPSLADPDIMALYRDKWMISYIGYSGPHRGLDTVMQALKLLRVKVPDLALTVIGPQGQMKLDIKREAEEIGVSDLVEIIERQPYDKMKSYIFASRLCLVPHKNFEHTQTTVPHKLFQYMLCARPVLVSDCKPLARIVGEVDGGYIFKADDPRDFAEKLLHVYTHPQEAEQKGKNAREGVLGPYSWGRDAERLLALYKDMECILS